MLVCYFLEVRGEVDLAKRFRYSSNDYPTENSLPIMPEQQKVNGILKDILSEELKAEEGQQADNHNSEIKDEQVNQEVNQEIGLNMAKKFTDSSSAHSAANQNAVAGLDDELILLIVLMVVLKSPKPDLNLIIILLLLFSS